MLSTITVIRKSREEIGTVGATDMNVVFIADDLSEDEYNVIYKHECSHIFLGHNSRRDAYLGDDGHFHVWNVACDIEIARHIYSKDDEAVITAPFSRIKGGITRDSFPDIPATCEYAEEIYDWLLEQVDGEGTRGNQSMSASDREKIAKIVEELVQEFEASAASRVADKNTTLTLEDIRTRRPTLSFEMDALLRYRAERVSSYRRAARREDKDFLLKGRVTEKRPPLVEIFVDRSGSFDSEKTKDAEARLKGILTKYGSSIRSDVWFFGGGRLTGRDELDGGDTPYHLIHQHLTLSKPKVAIVITDNDPVDDCVTPIKGVQVLCVPIGSSSTKLADKIGGRDVA